MRLPCILPLVLAFFVSACDAFGPTEDDEAARSLELGLYNLIGALESQAALNPEANRVILVARFGTSFGPSTSLNPFQNGEDVGLSGLVAACRESTGHPRGASGTIRNCLRERFSEGADPLDYSHGGIALASPRSSVWRIRQTFRSPDQVHYRTDRNLRSFPYVPLFEHSLLVLVPTLEFQERIYQSLTEHDAGAALLTSRYNAMALPFQTETQMSSQWVLEVLAASNAPLGSVTDRETAQSILRETGFASTPIVVGGIQRLGRYDGLFGAFDLEGHAYAYDLGVVEVITFRAIERWMRNEGLLQTVYLVRPDGVTREP